MSKKNCNKTTSNDQDQKISEKIKTTRKKKKKVKKIFKVPEPEAIRRCCYCGGTDYVLPRAKSLIKEGCRYCADCNGLMILYDYAATKELRSGLGALEHLQWNIGERGLGVLGGSIEEIETNLFKKLNDATIAFGNFKSDNLFNGKKETLQEHKNRIEKNSVSFVNNEIRKSIPKELKEGKTRKEIQVLVEKIKMEKQQQRKKPTDSKVVSMQEYKQRIAKGGRGCYGSV